MWNSFVGMSVYSKDFHLSLVTDVTSNTFLAALKKVIVGRKLLETYRQRNQHRFYNQCATGLKTVFSDCQNYCHQWHSLQLYFPLIYFPLIYIAKSTKYHLRRVLRIARLAYEAYVSLNRRF